MARMGPRDPDPWAWRQEGGIQGIEHARFRVESVFGASTNRKTENAQNEILDVRF